MELSDLSEEFNRKVNSAMSIVDNNKIILMRSYENTFY